MYEFIFLKQICKHEKSVPKLGKILITIIPPNDLMTLQLIRKVLKNKKFNYNRDTIMEEL